MIRLLSGLGLLVSSSAVWAASTGAQQTDFGVREVSGLPQSVSIATVPLGGKRPDISAAVGIGSQWGRVTSTYRSPAHNRRVGGVRNSFHLSGRAIDIARRPGVSHWQIAAAFRNAGYQLLESLDEGDHSHFAFGGGGSYRPPSRLAAQVATKVERAGETRWRIVFAPAGRSR